MLDKQHGNIVFECDECGESLYTETGDFAFAKYQFDTHDWKARKIGDVWTHKCPSCQS